MNIIKNVEDEYLKKELTKLVNNGTSLRDLRQFMPNIVETMNNIKKADPEETCKRLSDEIVEESNNFMKIKNSKGEPILSALSTCIYIPDEKGSYKLKFLGGKTSDGLDVTDVTKFDIASVTKMFTLALTFKLIDDKIICLNDKIADLDPRFSGLEDFTVKDIIKLCGTLYTKGNPKEGKTIEEANSILNTVFLKSNDRTRNEYTDTGAIVLSKVYEHLFSEIEGREVKFSEIVDEYIFKPLQLENTEFNPINYDLAGNGNKLGLVHDPKARALGGAVGSAGIFTTADDLTLVADNIFAAAKEKDGINCSLFSKKNLAKVCSPTFKKSKQNNKSYLGMYVKNSNRKTKWLNPLVYGKESFTAQGFTGAVATFDATNKIHNSFLVGSIMDGAATKPAGFMPPVVKGVVQPYTEETFKEYQNYIVGKTLELYLMKKYYNLSLEENSIDKTHTL